MSEKLKSGVWEEALLEELVYVIAHLAHAEQHMLELECMQGKPQLTAVINGIRNCRKALGEILFNNLRVGGESGGEFRSRAESFWCTIKHLAMSIVHCDEVSEKLISRLENLALSRGSEEYLKPLIRDLLDVYKVRRALRETLMKILREVPLDTSASSVRCREDLCVEADRES